MSDDQDLIGLEFGVMRVIKRGRSKKTGISGWICECVCGKKHLHQVGHLRNWWSLFRWCSCYPKKKPVLYWRSRTHGKSDTAEFRIWAQMLNRTANEKATGYANYGGRGITVCERWRNSFESFLEDMGERPSNLTLDRIDNDGNYEPENCRWANRKAQARNRRNNVMLTYDGETRCISEWAEHAGIRENVLRNRITQLGWDVGRALTTPVRKQVRKKKSEG